MKKENKENEKVVVVSRDSLKEHKEPSKVKLLFVQSMSCCIIYLFTLFPFATIFMFSAEWYPKSAPLCKGDIYILHVLFFIANFWLLIFLPSWWSKLPWWSKFPWWFKLPIPTLMLFLESESSLRTTRFPHLTGHDTWNKKAKQTIYLDKILSINTTQGIFALITTVIMILTMQIQSDTSFQDFLKILIMTFSIIVIGIQLYLAEVTDTSANIFHNNSIKYQAFFYKKVWVTYISYAFFSLLICTFFLIGAPIIMTVIIPLLLILLGYTYFIGSYEYQGNSYKKAVFDTSKGPWYCAKLWVLVATTVVFFSLSLYCEIPYRCFPSYEIVKAGTGLKKFLVSGASGDTKNIKDEVTLSELSIPNEIAVEGFFINQKLIRIRESNLKNDNLKIAVIQGEDDRNVITLKSVYLLRNKEGVYKVMVKSLPEHLRFMFSFPPVESIESIDWRNKDEIKELLWLLNILYKNEVNIEMYREKLEELLKKDAKHLIQGWIRLSIAAIYLWSGNEVKGESYFNSGFDTIPVEDKDLLEEIINDNETFKWLHKLQPSPALDNIHL